MGYQIHKEYKNFGNRTDWIISTVYFNNNFENGSADKIINICNKYNGYLLENLYKK